MRRFAEAQSAAARDELLDAIHGKGAFRLIGPKPVSGDHLQGLRTEAVPVTSGSSRKKDELAHDLMAGSVDPDRERHRQPADDRQARVLHQHPQPEFRAVLARLGLREGMLACVAPTRRALRVQPTEALRADR